MQPSKKLIHERQRRNDEEIKKVKNANRKVLDKTVECNRKRRKCSQYRMGEEVFVRYGK